MIRPYRAWAISALVLGSAFLVLLGQSVLTTSGVFAPDTAMNAARNGASAAVLADGRILVTGGNDASGAALISAEFLGTGASAGLMTMPRSGHISVTLKDGTVLVAGGRTSGGAVTNAAEIYDPSLGSWTPISSTLEPRAGATATLLTDGRVLIAGGEGSGAPLQTMQIFDPATGQFSTAAPMSSPRKNHAAALLLDGRVVIAGGSNGANALAGVDIYDPVANSVSAGPAMAAPREGLSATTLMKGTVLLAGGGNATTEILDVAAGSITPGPSMSAARSGHLALLLPDNYTVLMAGGSASSAAEIYVSWSNTFAPFGNLASARTGVTGGASKQSPLARVAGGADANGASSAVDAVRFPTVKTDRGDYAPGQTAIITGSGFGPNETVKVVIEEVVDIDGDSPITLTPAPQTDGGGNFSVTFPIDVADLNVRFYLSSTGQASGLTAGTTFTDNKANTVSVATPTSVSVQAGATATYGDVSVGFNGNAASCTITLGAPGLPPGASPVFGGVTNPFTVTATSNVTVHPFTVTTTAATVPGTYTFHVTATNGNNCQNQDTIPSDQLLTLTVTAGATSTTTAVSSSVNPSVYGQSVSFTATITPSSATGTVQFVVDGSNFGSPVNVVGGSATSMSTSSLSVANHTVTANYIHTGSFADSSGNLSSGQTVNKATATVVVTPYTVTYDGNSHTATVTSITGVNGETGATVGTVTLSTTHTNAGTYSSDTWSFTGTANYNNIASTTITDTINKATATVVVTPYTVTYDGLPHTATVASITGVNSETGATVGTVDVSNTTHTNAGTYSSDSWSFTGAANYNNIASTTITDTINKATATVVVTPYTVTYDGHAHTATVTSITGVNSETGPTVGTVDVSNTTHTNAGTYSSDTWSFTGAANYNNIATTTITDTINKATATVVVTPYTVTYDGHAHTATVTSITGVNGETAATVGTVDVSNTTHTAAGTYSSDTWSFTGANYNNIGPTTITDTINKATAAVVVTPYTVTYDGQSHTATVTSITGVNGETGATVGTVTLNTAHTNAGTYSTDSWSFAGTANYNNIASTTITDTINKATATVVVAPYTVTYDGNPHTATVTSITGVNGETGATVGTVTLNTTHTNAGTYSSDSWSFAGAANYSNIASTTITDTINKATATVVVTPYTVTYDGNSHSATITSITGVNGETGAIVGTVTLNTTHTNAGTYSTDSWSFAGTANYNNIASTTITDTINKANATVVVTPYTVTYDGMPHTATVTSITGVTGETGATVGTVTLNTTHTNAGTYATDTWSFTGPNYNNIGPTTITDTINKANATVVVTPYAVTYNGLPHTAAYTITGVNNETGATVGTVDASGTAHTNAGTYTGDTWSFTGAANYNSIASTTITDTINKANATVVVTPYTVTYDGSSHMATVTSIMGVYGEIGATVGTVTLNTTHINAGTYSSDSWSFAGTANYNNIASMTITDTINKANATVVVTPYTVMYDGHAHTATVTSITGVNSETGPTVGTVDVSNTTHTTAGTYSGDSWNFTGTANYNNIASTTITDTINKATATVVVAPYTVTYDGHAHAATVTSITGVNGETGAMVGNVDLTNTAHTAAGTYSGDTWSFAGANYNPIGPVTIGDTINKANATVVVTPYTVTYDGHPHTAAYTIAGVNNETGATVGTVDVSGTAHTNAGTYAGDTWSFTGAANYNSIASTTITDTINKATATVVVAPYTLTYDGNPHTATVTSITGVNGETAATVGTVTLNSAHTNAGTYSSDSWSFAGTANYNNIASMTITDTIDKANATVVVTPYSVTYDGHAHTAMVTSIAGVNGEMGATVGSVDVSNTTHTPAGAYSSDSWNFTGAANYNNIASTPITDTIGKANATVVVAPYTVTYDGHAHAATVTSITGVNGEMGSTVGAVDLSNTSRTNAGIYSGDTWSFTGANYNTIGPVTITDTINKANATVVVTPYTVTYDGHGHTATYTITGVNYETGATVGTVDVSATAHTNAGTYSSDTWSFTGSGNYNNIASTTITDTINKATATVVIAPYTVTYDGSSHTATVTSITGVNGETGVTVGTVTLSSAHTNAGTYSSDSWSFAGMANYNNIASTTITDTINKANATVVVTPYSVTYDGSAHTATVTSVTGVNGETGVTVGTVDVSNTTHTPAGTYSSDSWSLTGAANYNNIASMTITDIIGKATATVVVAPYTVTYDGTPHTATVTSITGVHNETGATVGTVDLSNTTRTAAGTYSGDTWSFAGANYNTIGPVTITDTINKATAIVLVTPYTVTYDGTPHTATYAITGVNGETGAIVGTVTLNSTHTNVGTYGSDTWSFTGTNYNNIASTTITDTINKANATVVVAPYSVTYDGAAHTATYTVNGVNGEMGATVGTVTLNTTHTNASTYAADTWSFSATANYNNISTTTITDTINKAAAIVVVTPYSVTYDGFPHTATVTSITGVNSETGATVGAVTLNTTHTNAGTYSSDSWSFTGTANYNNIASTTITDTIALRPTGTVLTSSLDTSVTPVRVVLTATVTSGGLTPIGSVTFADTVTGTLGTVALLPNGTATLSTATLGLGQHVITAAYTPTAPPNFTTSTSATNTAPTATITGPVMGSLNPINTPFNFTATFTDAASIAPNATAAWSFDTASVPGTVTESSGSGTVTKSYALPAAGVYAVQLTVNDNAGGITMVNTVNGSAAFNGDPAFVVVYDPNGGFVTGGGWIVSPVVTGVPSLAQYMSVTGKANFGFVSKYQKGANAPTGDTEFQFKEANMDFKSSTYQWLVVAGARAQYKGAGTINGAGNYGFLLTAIDGSLNGGGGIDKFRIKIWDQNNGDAIVYDNQYGQTDDGSAGTGLGGGSIVIHN